jgi:ATPase subunit of ABC transporter with duplicated ATPase domains
MHQGHRGLLLLGLHLQQCAPLAQFGLVRQQALRLGAAAQHQTLPCQRDGIAGGLGRLAAERRALRHRLRGGQLVFHLLQRAEVTRTVLGLGELLARMPSGLMQMVGETGWQLSHGERSRIFLARALLQQAPLTVLDESFAALDPQTLERCLRATLRRASTLVVIAHP